MNAKRILAVIVGVALSVFLSACEAKRNGEISPEEFSCYAMDRRGEILQGYEKELCRWYVFVPSAQLISDLDLHYTGNVTAVSDGELDQDAQLVSGAFSENGDTVEITLENEKRIIVEVRQSDLPSVQISLNGTTLDEIHLDKDKKYYRNTFVLSAPEGAHDLVAKNNVEIKGRGNTTWELYEKKGYQIEFAVPTSVLGMEKAKKWVLLANSSDDSMIRTQLVYGMAKKLDMEFVPDFAFVDLWIDGMYLGTYLLGEKVEIDGSRLDLQQLDGALFEHDEGYYKQEENWQYNVLLQRHFTLKDTVTGDEMLVKRTMETFDQAVTELAAFLFTTSSDKVTLNALSSMIDVDSFAKYYLVNEYVLNCESFATSFYWYMDGAEDVIHLGPIWDFDTCMGNDSVDFTQSYGENHVLYRYLLASPEFHARTESLYATYKDAFTALSEDADVLREQIRASAEMNYIRWDVLGKSSEKKDAADFHATFDDAVDGVVAWLNGRERYFRIAQCEAIRTEKIYSGMSKDHRTLYVYFQDEESHEQVRFAVWNLTKDDGIVMWYPAEQIDGVWRGTVDLGFFNSAGVYSIHAYVDGSETVYATGRSYVEEAVPSNYPISIQLFEERQHVQVLLKDLETCEQMSFAVWSDKNGQDDIRWIEATRNVDGWWECGLELDLLLDSGKFHVHAYETKDGVPILRNATVFQNGPE